MKSIHDAGQVYYGDLHTFDKVVCLLTEQDNLVASIRATSVISPTVTLKILRSSRAKALTSMNLLSSVLLQQMLHRIIHRLKHFTCTIYAPCVFPLYVNFR